MRGILRTLALLVVVAPVGAAFGEDETAAPANPWEAIRLKYQESAYVERFKAADADGDRFVTPEEAKAAGMKWECFADSARWKNADANGDGKLSLEEAIAEKRLEVQLFRKRLYEYQERLGVLARTPGIDAREREQLLRIRNGILNGSLTPEEAQEMLAGEKVIRGLEAAAKGDGVVTAAERERLRNALNDMSRRIYAEKRDDEGTKLPPAPAKPPIVVVPKPPIVIVPKPPIPKPPIPRPLPPPRVR